MHFKNGSKVIKRNRKNHFSSLNELRFIFLLLLKATNTSKDERILPTFNYIVSWLSSSSCCLLCFAKCQFFGLSLVRSTVFVCYYLHFGFINVFAYFYWLLKKLFAFRSSSLSLLVLLFILMMLSANLKRVHS